MAPRKNKPGTKLPPKGNKGNEKPVGSRPKFNFYWVYVFFLAFLLGTFFWGGSGYGGAKQITWKRFEQDMLSSHDVEKIVVVNKEVAEVFIKKDRLKADKYKDVPKQLFTDLSATGPQYYFNIGSVDSFESKMDKAQADFSPDQKVAVIYSTQMNWMKDIMSWLLPLALMIGLWILIMRSFNRGARRIGPMGGGSSIFNFGESKATLFDKDKKSNVTFEDVAGLQEAKAEVIEIVDFLKNPQRYTRLGAKIPKGVILAGPTGTGKTLLAKAVAGEAQVPFFSLSGSEFVEMFVGVGASRVRDLFKKAKEKAPCIIFIDEIDAIGRSREKSATFSSNDERESTLNQLLTEMDGFGTNTGVIVLAATNRASILDHALLRPGRFDRHIYLDLPNLNERKDIFKVHLRPIRASEVIDLEFLARQTPGFSGADIANVCNEAALIAARKKKEVVDKDDFMDAIDKIVAGLEVKSKVISPEEKKTIAYHEAGHTIMSWMLKHADRMYKVTIVPRGRSLGASWTLPEERQLTTTARFFDELSVALGGRAAEETVFGEISSGALNDLEKVTKQAYTMVAYFGLDEKLGNISYYDSSGSNGYTFQKPYSEETAKIIDEEVRKLVDKAYQQAKKVLTENRGKLDQLAALLLEKEVVFKEDIERIVKGRSAIKENGQPHAVPSA